MFRNRQDAGQQLAEAVRALGLRTPVVLGLPRGGVPVAAEVARALAAPLDVLVVRKLGVPFQPELAMGAVGEGGVLVVNQRVVALSGTTATELAAAEQRERAALDEEVRRFRGDRPHIRLTGRTAVLVDDGIATGSTARAGCAVARALGATHIVLAAPVCARDSARQLAADADDVICLDLPRNFAAVGQFYADFRATQDADVLQLLDRAARGGL